MRPGYDSTKRNRNIGTAKQGHGRSNRLVIPWPDERVFYERLNKPVSVCRSVFGRETVFLVEPPYPGFVHACTVDDIVRMLELVPAAERFEVRTYVLRQPTRKQRLIRPVWGRLVYSANLGKYSGPTIQIEAQRPGETFKWGRRLVPTDVKALERLRADGHKVRETKRNYLIEISLESIRTTQLYRTLLHEVGHYVHYISSVRDAVAGSANANERLRAEETYWSKPSQELETFANGYAQRLGDILSKGGRIPFERILTGPRLARDGLRRDWFCTSANKTIQPVVLKSS